MATEKTLTAIDEGIIARAERNASPARAQRLGMRRNPARVATSSSSRNGTARSFTPRAAEVFVKRAFVFFNRCINGSPTEPRQELRKMLLALLAAVSAASSDQDATRHCIRRGGRRGVGVEERGMALGGRAVRVPGERLAPPGVEGVGGCSRRPRDRRARHRPRPLARRVGRDDPAAIGLLDALSYRLLLTGNGFTGTLPTQIGLLTKLKTLGISANSPLSGTLPTQLAQLTRLEHLSLESNRLSGTVPAALAKLDRLGACSLSSPVYDARTNAFACPLPRR